MQISGWVKRSAPWVLGGALLVVAVPATLADGGANHKTRQTRPIQLGTSGGNINDFAKAFCYGGTLGALVQDSAAQYILSNNHVLARTNRASVGDDIVQPGLIDVNCQKISADAVADLTQWVTLQFKGKGSTPINYADAAIAQVRGGQVDPNGSILDVGTLNTAPAVDKVGCEVKKSGRTTGLTTGTISAVDVTVDVNYGGGKVARFADQMRITDGSFSAGGDSGSLVVRDVGTTPRPVGLLFAGSSDSTLANPIQRVLEAYAGKVVVGTTTDTTSGDCPVAATGGASTARAQEARSRHEASLFQTPSVVGVGVGVGPAIEVYLAQENGEARRRIPTQLDGVPVRVVVTGEFNAR